MIGIGWAFMWMGRSLFEGCWVCLVRLSVLVVERDTPVLSIEGVIYMNGGLTHVLLY